MPPSPFAEEKLRLGAGLLAGESERVDKYRPRLTEADREAIGRTSGARGPVARRYGISEEYVSELRGRYKTRGLIAQKRQERRQGRA